MASKLREVGKVKSGGKKKEKEKKNWPNKAGPTVQPMCKKKKVNQHFDNENGCFTRTASTQYSTPKTLSLPPVFCPIRTPSLSSKAHTHTRLKKKRVNRQKKKQKPKPGRRVYRVRTPLDKKRTQTAGCDDKLCYWKGQ